MRKGLTVVGPVPHPLGDVLPRRPFSGGGEGLVQHVSVQHETVVEPPRNDVHLEEHTHTYKHTHTQVQKVFTSEFNSIQSYSTIAYSILFHCVILC